MVKVTYFLSSLHTDLAHAPARAGVSPAGEQLCNEGPEGPGGQQAVHNLATWPSGQEDQWLSGGH